MISEIHIKNFKSHLDSQLELKNLNILTGVNGTGKSSFTQSLLLLRQSFKHNRLTAGIQLNEVLVDIGLGIDALCQYAKEDLISIKIVTSNEKQLEWEMKVPDSALDSTFLKFNKLVDDNKILENFSLFNKNFQYLSAERLAPQESYEKDDYAVETERQISREKGKGELIAHFLNYYGNENMKKISFPMLLHPKNKNENLLSQTDSWLREISPNVNVSIAENDRNFELRYNFDVKDDFPTNNFRAENVGFGITYSLPLIVAILSAEKGSIIIIENPEAHIHPSGQAKLAELMAIAAQCGIQLIVETHSDHIINGILVATKKFEETGRGVNNENVKIYLFERSESGHSTEVKNIEVLVGGRIQSPPKGFFDQIALDRKYLRGF